VLKKEKIERLHSAAMENRCPSLRIFVSSTFMDLKKERLAVKRAAELCLCVPILAEDVETLPGKSLPDQISYWLSEIDVLVLLVSERYGELAPTKVSWTQEEVTKAAALKKLIFPYFIKTKIATGLELDQNQRQRLQQFKEWLINNPEIQPPQYPKNNSDLLARVVRDIKSLQSDIRADSMVDEFEKFSRWEE